MYNFFVTLFLTLSVVTALPGGAPSCEVGEAAPQSLHLNIDRNPQTGPLSTGTYTVTINGALLVPGEKAVVPAQAVNEVIVSSETGLQPFRGVLAILNKEGTVFTNGVELSVSATDPLLQEAFECDVTTGRSGVTHKSPDLKTSAELMLNVDSNLDDVFLDVNVVVANNDIEGSIYYYDRYTLQFTGATSAPTQAPADRKCGLLRLGFFCPFTFCGIFGRLLFGDENCKGF